MEHFEEKVARIQKFRPIDDVFFQVLIGEKGVCEEIIRVILEDPELTVLTIQLQKSIKNLNGCSAHLCAMCRLGTGEIVNIEVQRSDDDNHLKMVRYNTSCIIANVTNPGDSFEQMPTVYAVYISELDPFGLGFTTYHVDNVIREKEMVVDDGVHSIFVNAKVEDGTDIAKLMKCLLQTEVNDPQFPRISERVHFLKHSEEGIKQMCAIMED